MKKRQVAFLGAKIIFMVVVMAWLFHKVDPLRVWNSVRHAHPAPILLGICFGLVIIFTAAWRWHRLLLVFDISIPLKSLFSINFIGQFFMMFLPGPTGDDLTRMLYISRLTKGRIGEACSTVLIDRCIGLASVLVLSVFCVPWQWPLLKVSHQTYLMAVAILIAGILICIAGAFYIIAAHPTHKWFERCLRFLPPHTFRDELARIWGLLCINKSPVAQVFGAAIITQLFNCIVFFLAGLAVDIPVPLLTWCSFVPIVLAANVAPITIAGIGVREYLLVLFLHVLGQVGADQALAASFVSFSMMLAVSLMGGIFYIFYKPAKKENESCEGTKPVTQV